jgi:hypothetical protein
MLRSTALIGRIAIGGEPDYNDLIDQQAGKLGQAALSGVLGGRDRPVPIRFGKLFKGDPINITKPIYEIAVRRSLLHIVAPTPATLHMNDKPRGGGLIENSRADNRRPRLLGRQALPINQRGHVRHVAPSCRFDRSRHRPRANLARGGAARK